MIQRNFNLHLHAGHKIPLVINCNQYDSGEQWLFTLYNGAVQYTPSSGAIVGIKSDRLGIINTGTVDGNGRVVINETRQMTAAVGKNVFELLIDDQTHGTANFVVLVEPRPGDQADFSESDLSLLEQAIEGTSATAIAQGVSDWMDDNLTPTTPVVDSSLTVSGAAADAKKTGDEISALKSAIESGSSLTSAIKSALLQIARKVAYIDEDGQDYYDDLYDALYPPIVVTAITLSANSLSFGTLNSTQQLTATTTPAGGEIVWTSSNPLVATVSATGLVTAVAYGNATITATSGNVSATCSVAITQATVTSISAVFNQVGVTVYDTDTLDSLKAHLAVRATYSNSSTVTLADSDYTLSGTLTAGTSPITVSYGGQTTTFNVTVSKSMCIAYSFGDIPWTSGKIDDTGALVSDSSRSTWDEFINADYITGFAIVSSTGPATNTLYLSEFDSSKAFLGNRSAATQTYEANANAKFVKLGTASSVIGREYSFLKMEETSASAALTIENTNLDTNGAETATTGKSCTDYIDLSSYTSPVFTLQSINGGIVICFYDSSKTFISRKATGSGTGSGTIPSNAKYVRIACSVGTGYAQLSSFLI